MGESVTFQLFPLFLSLARRESYGALISPDDNGGGEGCGASSPSWIGPATTRTTVDLATFKSAELEFEFTRHPVLPVECSDCGLYASQSLHPPLRKQTFFPS